MQSRLFQTNQKRLFERLEGIERRNGVRPDAEESITFWSSIWSKSVQHNEKAEWLEEVKNKVTGVEKQENVKITKEMVENQLRKTLKWKASGPDHENGCWLKSFTKLHEILAMLLDEIQVMEKHQNG